MPQFSAHGTREGVLKKLESWPDEKERNGSDQCQLEAFRKLIESEIGALQSNGVRVIADCAAHEKARTIAVTIIAQHLSV